MITNPNNENIVHPDGRERLTGESSGKQDVVCDEEYYLQRPVMAQAAGPNYEDKMYHTDGHCAPQSANPMDLTPPTPHPPHPTLPPSPLLAE